MSDAQTGPLDPAKDYPLGTKRPELLKTPTGKALEDITMQAVLAGEITADDLRITPEALELQAQLGDASGRNLLAENMRRAAELTAVPDDRVLEMYNALRPNASSKEELIAMAEELEGTYGATRSGALVREAADVYDRRGFLAASV